MIKPSSTHWSTHHLSWPSPVVCRCGRTCGAQGKRWHGRPSNSASWPYVGPPCRENHRKAMGKWWFNRDLMGNPWEDHRKMMVSWWFNGVSWDLHGFTLIIWVILITTSLRPHYRWWSGLFEGNHPLLWPEDSGEWIIIIYPHNDG